MKRNIVIFILSLSAQTTHLPHWTYDGATGPGHWSQLSPDFSWCKAGRQQSPIDITNPVISDLPAIEFDYRPAELKIIDNGHTIQVNYPSGSFITVQGHRYELLQFHFHHPSEELINGKRYELSIHLVHQDAEQHKAVVAVLAITGASNPVLEEIFKQLPRLRGTEISSAKIINARDLLPKDGGYFAFTGSLTTPPCTEGVSWFVLKTPVTVSRSGAGEFIGRYPHNARPIQPLNGRRVLSSR